MTAGELAMGAAGMALLIGVLLIVVGRRHPEPAAPLRTGPPSSAQRRWDRLLATARSPGSTRGQDRRRTAVWLGIGLTVWIVTGWPVAGIALAITGIWLPWLLGAGRVAQERIERLEALETWCRRMADTLTGGGALGLAQAIAVTSHQVDPSIAPAVRGLASRLRDGEGDLATSMREFTDTLDDRVGDTVGAALLLALHQQSTGVSTVLRQLAEGVARDVRARREVESARAESRQSIKTLLIIQGGVLVMLALIPTFSTPYRSPGGQVVMVVLLAATVGLLAWMRRLALGQPAPRFLGSSGERP